nr:M64 family metallopeptidase [Pseudomarimonas arenosa]
MRPSDLSEPFTDLNGDGLLSQNDPALFELHVRQLTKSLLASDYWQEHRDKLNVYALWLPSAQAGYSLYVANGSIERDTPLRMQHVAVTGMFSSDYFIVESLAQKYSELSDVVVALSNQPIAYARENVSGNHMNLAADASLHRLNGSVFAHEMGHAVAQLADEYIEFGQETPDPGPHVAANLIRIPDPDAAPWSAFIATPNRRLGAAHDIGVGIFEGGNYSADHYYRSQYNTLMKGEHGVYGVWNRALLAEHIAKLIGHAKPRHGLWWDPDRSGHGFDLELVDGSLSILWYTYRSDGTPTWYLASAPWVGGQWQADLLRFRNQPTVQSEVIGTLSFLYHDRENGVLAWEIDGEHGSARIEKFRFGDASPTPDHTGVWYDPSDPGWGFTFEEQGSTQAVVAYFYDHLGEATWAIGTGDRQSQTIPLLHMTGTHLCPLCSGEASTQHESIGQMTTLLHSETEGSVSMSTTRGASSWRREGVQVRRLNQ